MSLDLLLLLSGSAITLIIIVAFWNTESDSPSMRKRVARVSGVGPSKDLKAQSHREQLKRRTSDSDIALLDMIIKTMMPNPQKLRGRLAKTGTNISLGEYLIINALSIMVTYFIFVHMVGWSTTKN